MNLDLTQLKKDIAEFEAFKESIDRQQVTFPLDKKSLDVMRKDLMVPTGNNILTANGPVTVDSLEVDINGKRYYLQLAS